MSRACRAGAASTIPANHSRPPRVRERDSMLAAIRAFAKSWVASVLFGLLIVSFIVFGIGNYRTFIHPSMGNAVITAGLRTVTPIDFKRAFDNYKSRVEQQVGQQITPEMAAENG